ncbi:hypothetical protein AMQ83_35160, partial [Paenibacillus riograndensis]
MTEKENSDKIAPVNLGKNFTGDDKELFVQKPLKNINTKQSSKNYSKGGEVPSKNKIVDKGNTLEYRMKRLLFSMGYYSKIGIELLTNNEESGDKITDLDVYGLYVHRDFTSKSTWVDCKSGNVEIHKRISWIKGIMGEFQINDTIFVAGGARTSVKQYARKSGIQILDLKIIEKLESDFNVKKEEWKGSW